MNGISPRTISLTAPQSRISTTVAEAVPDLPTVVIDMIAQYACVDISLAQRPLIFDTNDQLVDCDENRKTMEAMKVVLVSSQIDPVLKRSIFLNVEKTFSFKKIMAYKESFNSIFDEIRRDGEQIILDYIDFSGITLLGLNLSGASMVAAKFNGSEISFVKLTGADLTGASFQQTKINSSNLNDAIITKSVFDRTDFDRVNLSGADLTGVRYHNVAFSRVIATGLISDDDCLLQVMKRSVYRREQITSDPCESSNMQLHLEAFPDSPSAEMVILSGRYISNDPSAMVRLHLWPTGVHSA